tara:strand:- start:3786 stop:4175 length:390 start_codon:yes stop_codon:yes gene_type:complete
MIFTRPRGSREYVLERERDMPTDAQTIFLLDDLRERDRVKVMDSFRINLEGEGSSVGGSGMRTYTAIKCGLRGWRNAKYADGTEVPFVSESGSKQPSDETLALLSWEDKSELAGEIIEAAFADEDDKEK